MENTEDLYTSAEKIRWKLLARLIELVNSNVDQWSTDINFSYRTKDAIFKNKENIALAENSLRLVLLATLDFTGYLEFSWIRTHLDFSEMNDLSHRVTQDDAGLLRQMLEIIDFFYTTGTPADVSLVHLEGPRVDSIYPDWLLQIIFLLLDSLDQRGMDVLENKAVDRIRRILTTQPTEDASEGTARRRRTLAVIFLSTKLILSSCKNVPSVEELRQSSDDHALQLFPMVQFLKSFVHERISYLSAVILTSDGNKIVDSDLYCLKKDSPLVFFVSFLTSPEWSDFLENTAFQSFFATRKVIRIIAPLQKPVLPFSISSTTNQEKLGDFLREVRAISSRYTEDERARVQARVEGKNLDNTTSRSLLRKINREQRDK